MSKQQHSELEAAIGRCMIADRFHFNKALHSKNKRGQVRDRIERSVALAESRQATLPVVNFPEALPVSQRVEDIKAAIDQHQVVIIAGETGSGKTTQIPKICLDMGRGVYGSIGHTQPRRVAARTVSHRIAEELSVEVGKEVGYQVRFSDHTEPGTHVKVMTDGILLAETRNDKFLEAYDTIIIDEAHERSLNIDFLLGYLKRILPKRPDLKVIVTSATIDVERFSKHFGGAPIVEVSGRMYPVNVEYRPLDVTSKTDDTDELVTLGILDALREIEQQGRRHSGPGDVLVFLSGEREIREVAHQLRKSDLKGIETLPLYSRLSVAEQNKVFQSGRQGRRVVLATNVAETSLTVPGIRYVIDPGFARISRYSVRSKVQQLPIESISKASAEQRKGRCGRVSEGTCYRLYSEEDFEARPDFTTPETMRTNLAAVILQMLVLRLGDIGKFPFVERPDQRQINDGFHLLKELQAVDEKKQVTRLGKEMAQIPIDLRLARMLLEAGKNGCLAEVLTIVSAHGTAGSSRTAARTPAGC
ncbi:MAG: ATP-dependent RNA helicase HrpA [Gammaproteobacteria bacterium]|nr:ATP-dependent RNA helicase HrpA [Gammaproteobacteria bacterium]